MVPQIRELDPSAGPLQFFGAELRRARAAAGLSQDQLGQRLGYSAAQVGKVETGERAPSQDFAQGCDQVFPDAGGLFARIYQLARRWDGGYPSWFAEWVDVERRGYLQRTTDPADRRAKIIEFTDQGWATVNLALSVLGELEADIVGRLGEPAVRQLRSTLLQILDRPAYTRRERSSGPPS